MFSRFVASEQVAGVVLLFCVAMSLALSNGVVGQEYAAFWERKLGPLSLSHWINDGLMAIFFLLIGLELEREVYVGELSSIRSALLPAIGALGGMVVPALIPLRSQCRFADSRWIRDSDGHGYRFRSRCNGLVG